LTERLALVCESSSEQNHINIKACKSPLQQPEQPSFNVTASSKNHTKTSEYDYLTTMLREAKERSSKLQNQLQVQTRQNLSDSEALVKTTRQIAALEADLLRMRADNYQLKMRLEKKEEERGEMSSSSSLYQQRPRKKIFENIKFEEELKELKEQKEKFQMAFKENGCPNVDAASKLVKETEVKKLDSGGVKKKKSVAIAPDVKADDNEIASAASNVGEESNSLRKRNVGGGRRKKNYNEVIDAQKETEQCAQQ
jgi:hypothetical protein